MSLKGQLEYLFNPRSVAVIGASNTFGKWGFHILNRALAGAAERRVYPVSKDLAEVQGVTAYRGVGEVPEPLDLAVIAVLPAEVPQAMQDCAARGVKAALIISAGFGEIGGEGARLQNEVVQIAARAGVRVVGPNSMGHLDVRADFCTGPFIPRVERGHIGFIAQSGNVGIYILQCGMERGIGFSKFVSSGNEADLCVEDYVEYLAQDDATRVIACYVEGLREGRRFLEVARETTKRKPIVVMKGGATKSGAKAALSHTASLSGEEAVNDAALRQAGVIRVREVDELLDVSAALLRQPLPGGRRVGILTAGGGFGVITADACESRGLVVATLSPDTVDRLDKILPPRWPRANPVDLVAGGFNTYRCLWPLMDDENVDAILAICSVGTIAWWQISATSHLPPGMREEADRYLGSAAAEELANLDVAIRLMDTRRKPLIVSRIPGVFTDDLEVSHKLRNNGIMPYPTPERATSVLAHLANYGEYVRTVEGC